MKVCGIFLEKIRLQPLRFVINNKLDSFLLSSLVFFWSHKLLFWWCTVTHHFKQEWVLPVTYGFINGIYNTWRPPSSSLSPDFHSLVARACCLIFILSLQVKERPDVGVYVKDLSSYVMNNADDLDKTMTVGNKNRESPFISNRCVTITAESSRAHWLIFIINKWTDTWNL